MTPTRLGDFTTVQRIQYDIREHPDGQSRAVDGITVPEAPGLGLHVSRARVNITHLASGKLVAQFHTLGAALECAQRLGPISNWTRKLTQINPYEQQAWEDIITAVRNTEECL